MLFLIEHSESKTEVSSFDQSLLKGTDNQMNEQINSQSISWGLAKRGKTHSGKL